MVFCVVLEEVLDELDELDCVEVVGFVVYETGADVVDCVEDVDVLAGFVMFAYA